MFGHQDDSTTTLATPAQTADQALDSAPLDAPSAPPAVSDSLNLDLPAATPSAATPPVDAAAGTTSDDLLSIKQQALQQLSPLVGHLNQTPEEKFRTTMMMIQAADNQSLLKSAYDAAQAITDEKARAQALLDIVNEINYFTQRQQQA